MIPRRVRTTTLLITGVTALCLASNSAAKPPEETLSALEEALGLFECWGGDCTYTMRFRTEISKTDGSDSQEQVRLMEITYAGGASTTNTLEVIQDGVDVTDDEEAQKSFGAVSTDEDHGADEDKDGEQSMNLDLTLPLGEDAVHYRFGDAVSEGGLMVASFEPVDGKSRKDLTDLSVGRLAWDPQTLEPRWIEFSYARNPRMVISMSSRIGLGQLAGKLVPLSWNSEGVGGILVFKRRLKMEMSIEGLR